MNWAALGAFLVSLAQVLCGLMVVFLLWEALHSIERSLERIAEALEQEDEPEPHAASACMCRSNYVDSACAELRAKVGR